MEIPTIVLHKSRTSSPKKKVVIVFNYSCTVEARVGTVLTVVRAFDSEIFAAASFGACRSARAFDLC